MSSRLLCGLLAVTSLAFAQPQEDALDACTQIEAPTARLACFDQQMQLRHASRTPSSQRASSAPVAAAAPLPPAVPSPEAPPPPRAKEPDRPLEARIQRVTVSPDHRYIVVLDNGQVWEQTEGRPGLLVQAQDTVTIRPGVLGSFFLQTGQHQSFRVRRVR